MGREWRRSWGWSPAPAARQGHYSLSFSSRSSRFGAAGSFCFIFIFFSRFRSRSELPAPRLLLHNASHSAAPGPASPGPASSCPRPGGGGAGGGRAPPGWQRPRPCAAGALQARLPAAAAAQLFYCSPFLPPPPPPPSSSAAFLHTRGVFRAREPASLARELENNGGKNGKLCQGLWGKNIDVSNKGPACAGERGLRVRPDCVAFTHGEEMSAWYRPKFIL